MKRIQLHASEEICFYINVQALYCLNKNMMKIINIHSQQNSNWQCYSKLQVTACKSVKQFARFNPQLSENPTKQQQSRSNL